MKARDARERLTVRGAGLLWALVALGCLSLVWRSAAQQRDPKSTIGRELAIPRHLQDGEEFKLPPLELIEHGKKLFIANWTDQDGGGRPLSKGNGQLLADRTRPLTGARAFNRLSGPDANSCQGCHNGPYQAAGGGGDFVANAFVMADRFDFVTFERGDTEPTRGAVDERGRPVTLQTVGNSRLTPGLSGAGYLEMLARQMTGDLRRIRDQVQPGQSKALMTKGISFGMLTRRRDGSWDTRGVQGLSRPSVAVATASGAPSLLIRPWRQSGSVVSLRDITNTSFNVHHGIQTMERFGVGTDPDGDSVINEMTRADVTAVTVWQATLPVPGRVIPNDPQKERLILTGERLFDEIRCSSCHVASLPLERKGWIYSEPGPYNTAQNLRRGEARSLELDLANAAFPQPRLMPSESDSSVIQVPAFTDFKLHDITDAADSDAAEPLDINERPGSPQFTAGNRKFLTRRLWGVGNQPAHFHHGLFTSLKQAVLAHAGEALDERRAFERLAKSDQDAVIDFLHSLQVLPPGTKALVVDERYQPKPWPPAARTDSAVSRALK